MSGGVFCIENWSGRLETPDSVQPLLDLLELNGAASALVSALQHHVSSATTCSGSPSSATTRWALALHGNPGGVYVGSQRISLETLTAWSSKVDKARALDGRGQPTDWLLNLEGKVLYLGSCASLRVSRKRLQELRKSTGAVAICGYTKSVDWFDAAAFEVLLLSALANAMDKKRHTARETVRRLWRDAKDLLENILDSCASRTGSLPRADGHAGPTAGSLARLLREKLCFVLLTLRPVVELLEADAVHFSGVGMPSEAPLEQQLVPARGVVELSRRPARQLPTTRSATCRPTEKCDGPSSRLSTSRSSSMNSVPSSRRRSKKRRSRSSFRALDAVEHDHAVGVLPCEHPLEALGEEGERGPVGASSSPKSRSSASRPASGRR